jgi:hypothetical protein
MIPNSGKRIRGRSAVTAIAVPSPIHQQAIKTMTAKNRFPEKVIPSGSGMNKTIENNINPPTSTKIFFLNKGCKSVNTSSSHGKARSYLSFVLLTYFPFYINQEKRQHLITDNKKRTHITSKITTTASIFQTK